jgi:hypothetical protein
VSLVLLFWAAAQASGDPLPCDLTVHPDRIDRLTYGAHNQQAYFGPPLPDPAPFTDTPGLATSPSWLARRSFGAHLQQAYTAPPDSFSALDLTVHPDRFPAPSRHAVLAQAFAGPPIVAGSPGQFIPTVYADSARGRSFLAHLQQAYVAPPQSFEAFDLTVHPDWLPPKGRHAALAQAYAGPIEPDAVVPAASFDLSVHPDRLDRRTFPASLQLAHVLPVPPGAPTFDLSVHPDRLDRRTFPAHLQLAHVLPVPPGAPTFDLSVFPDAIAPKRALATHLQQAFVLPVPPGTPTFDLSVHPDRVQRPTYPAHLQQAYTGPIEPGGVAPAGYVDIIWRSGASVTGPARSSAEVQWTDPSGATVIGPTTASGVVVSVDPAGVRVVGTVRETGVRVRGQR